MKRPAILVAALAAVLLSYGADSFEQGDASFAASEVPVQTAGLSWRCGKNNPAASWGTFGNGCLKQKRKWKREHQQSNTNNNGNGVSNTLSQQPAKAKRKK